MDWKSPKHQQLIKAVLAIKTEAEARRFLRDLMTATEIEEYSKRLWAAEMLAVKTPYSTIEQVTGLSSTTVARVAKWLNGPGGGYRVVISRLHHHGAPQ